MTPRDDYSVYSERVIQLVKERTKSKDSIKPLIEREPHLRLFYDHLTQHMVTEHLLKGGPYEEKTATVVVIASQLIKTALWCGTLITEEMARELHLSALQHAFDNSPGEEDEEVVDDNRETDAENPGDCCV